MKYILLLLYITLSYSAFCQIKSRTVFDDVDFVVEPIRSINVVESDISPLFIDDTLYFSAVREKYFNKKKRERKNMAFYDMYYATLNQEGLINSTRTLAAGFGDEFHEGPAAYCVKTKELFITLSNVIDPDTVIKVFPREEIKLRLAIMKKINGVWKLVEELPFNDDRFHFAHPAISQGGDTLIFSSDIDSLTIGNADLFMSVRRDGEWSDPVNLGDKINTKGNDMFPTMIDNTLLSFASDGHAGCFGGLDIYYTNLSDPDIPINLGGKINSNLDDFGLVLHKDKEVGYFASNRGGVGSDDIFRLDFNRLYFIFNGKVVDDKTDLPIPLSKVELKGCDGKVLHTEYTDSLGNFQLEVLKSNCPLVTASKEDYSDDSKDVSRLTFVELRLTQKRFREIIVLDRETNDPIPQATISCDGRVMYKSDMDGHAYLLPPFPYEWDLLIKKEGFFDHSLVLDPDKFIGSIARDTVWLYKKELYKTFVLKNIYYNFDKWEILKESAVELDKLVVLMKVNSDLKAELGSHTDSRGSDEYNEWLADKRSKSAVQYIINKGISQDRIFAKGYGEYQLVNQCENGVDCPDIVHRINRRTEFKILDFKNQLIESNLLDDVTNMREYQVDLDGNVDMEEFENFLKVMDIETTGSVADMRIREIPGANKTSGIIYRIQLISTSRKIGLDHDFFYKAKDLGEKYEILINEVDNSFKYQLGSFNSRLKAEKIKAELRALGYRGCFIIVEE